MLVNPHSWACWLRMIAPPVFFMSPGAGWKESGRLCPPAAGSRKPRCYVMYRATLVCLLGTYFLIAEMCIFCNFCSNTAAVKLTSSWTWRQVTPNQKVVHLGFSCLPSLKLTAKAPENGPFPKRTGLSSNHPFSGRVCQPVGWGCAQCEVKHVC